MQGRGVKGSSHRLAQPRVSRLRPVPSEAVDFGAAEGEDAGFLARQPRAGMTTSRVFSWFVILARVAAARGIPASFPMHRKSTASVRERDSGGLRLNLTCAPPAELLHDRFSRHHGPAILKEPGPTIQVRFYGGRDDLGNPNHCRPAESLATSNARQPGLDPHRSS